MGEKQISKYVHMAGPVFIQLPTFIIICGQYVLIKTYGITNAIV